MRRAIAASLTAATLFSFAPQAAAHHMIVRDQEDTPGRLDVRRVEVVGSSPRSWIIKTYRTWGARGIYDKGYLLIYLDTFGGNRFDYYVLIQSLKRKLKGSVWRDLKNANDFVVGPTKINRSNRRTVRTTVPFRKLRVPDTQADYRWHVRTIYLKRSCWKAVCMDRAPQGGSVVEPLIP
ncbi:MAG: hypothetical protein M3285_06515 [Actinomycetota bacterium]|nr:hypothetical protein [Actinomycetota bacterium]